MTKTKYAVSVAALLLLAGALLAARWISRGEKPAPPKRDEPAESASGIVSENTAVFDLSSFRERKVLAVYFHGNSRCATCLRIERIARDAVASRFGGVAGAEAVLWAAVNYDVEENDRYISEFEIELPSLILIEAAGGKAIRWKNLRNTWDLVEDEQSLSKYVCDEIAAFMSP